MTDNIDVILDAILAQALDDGAAPGLVGAVGSRDALLYTGAVGLREDAIFWLASCTKLVTSIAALQLVARGKLSLDAPISGHLPKLRDPQVLTGFDEGGAAQFRPAARAITLRHLLTHTSGLGYDFLEERLVRARGSDGPPPPHLLASIQGPLLFDPEDGWSYGVGIDWAGLAVEAASRQSLDTYFKDHIFTPLGITDTGFAAPPEATRAPLHMRREDGGFDPIPPLFVGADESEFLAGGAGLHGTARDFLKLLQALLGPSQILDEASRTLLFTVASGDHRAGIMPRSMLSAPFDIFPAMATGWSLGGAINPDRVPGGRNANSLAWAGIANCYYWVDPTADVCAVLCAQYFPFADPKMLTVLRAFEDGVYASR